MSERNIRHVGDVFGNEPGHRKQENILERKTSFNMFKNKQAPKPPSGQQMLPKIGNYQPKILLEPKQSRSNHDPQSEEHIQNGRQNMHNGHQNESALRSNHNASQVKPMIIGDKDELLKIEHCDHEEQEENPVPAPRRKRQAPMKPEVEMNQVFDSENPAFGRRVSQRSDEERLDMDFEEQGGDIDFAEGIDNPAFTQHRDRQVSTSSSQRDNFETKNDERRFSASDANRDVSGDRHVNARRHSDKVTYPYIPPPDYEDEEVTMEFDEEADAFMNDVRNYRNLQHSRPHTVYKDRDLEGEDFGRYLEDDYEFDAPRRPMGPPAHFKNRQAPRPPNNNNKKYSKQHEKKNDKKAGKMKKKQDKLDASKRNTIRDFTFSDSKIGWGDRTVKSTSAKGRYIKREKDRKRIDTTDQFNIQNGAPEKGSYEEFLRVKNGIPLDSPNSSDSGVEMENHKNMDMYLKSQPKHMRQSNYDRKPSVWQRLTWRFKKNVQVTRQEEKYAYSTHM